MNFHLVPWPSPLMTMKCQGHRMLMGNNSFMGNKRILVTIQDVYQDKYDLSFGNITFPYSVWPLSLGTFNNPMKTTEILMVTSTIMRQTGPIITIKHVANHMLAILSHHDLDSRLGIWLLIELLMCNIDPITCY